MILRTLCSPQKTVMGCIRWDSSPQITLIINWVNELNDEAIWKVRAMHFQGPFRTYRYEPFYGKINLCDFESKWIGGSIKEHNFKIVIKFGLQLRIAKQRRYRIRQFADPHPKKVAYLCDFALFPHVFCDFLPCTF